MRVSTSFITSQSIKNMLNQQSELIRTQTQLSSGKKILAPSDDPSAASRILDLNDAINKTTQQKENAEYAIQKLGLEETALVSTENILQRVRELTVQAGNSATLDIGARQAIAEEIKLLNDELFDLANTKDANSEYLFSGFQSSTQPFTINSSGNYIYNGDQGQLALQIGSNRQVVSNDSGADVFQLIRNGNGMFITDNNSANTGSGIISTGSVQNPSAFLSNDYNIRFTSNTTFEIDNVTSGANNIIGSQTYTDGASIVFDGVEVSISQTPINGDVFSINASRNQDIFTSINNLVMEIEGAGVSQASNAQYAQGIANALNNIDRAMETIINVRTKVGARLNSIDLQVEENEARNLQMKTVKSQIEDLDFAEAITKLTFQTTALQAAQQSYVKIQGLSLFNYI